MCYVYGCDEDSVSKIRYRDCMSQTYTERRCATCAKQLRNNDKNTVLSEDYIGEEDEDDNNSNSSPNGPRALARRKKGGRRGSNDKPPFP